MKNLLKVIGSSALIYVGGSWNAVMACGPQLYADEARFSLFRPETADDKSLLPFHYRHSHFRTYEVPSVNTNETDENIKEWVAFGNNTFSRRGTEILQYQTSPEAFLQAYNSKNLEQFEGNDFAEFLFEPKNAAALTYFAFAKQVESAQNFNHGWNTEWSEESYFNKRQFAVLAEFAAQKLKSKRLPQFIKERYAFQLIKCAYYDKLYNDGTAFTELALKHYDQTLGKSNSVTARWALIYYAELLGSPEERTIKLIEAFEKSEDKRVRALSLVNQKDLENIVVQYPSEPTGRIAAIMLAFNNTGKGLDLVKEIYQDDRHNPFLQVLMAREINKLEDWIWSNKYLQFTPYLRETNYWNQFDFQNSVDTGYLYYYHQQFHEDLDYLNDVLDVYRQMNFGDDIKKNNFKDIAVVHLLNMSGKYKEAEAALKLLNSNQTTDANLQINYEKVITLPHVEPIHAQRTKDLISMSLSFIESYNAGIGGQMSSDPNLVQATQEASAEFPHLINPQILIYLGRVYLEQGARLEGALFLQKAMAAHPLNEYGYIDYDDSLGYSGLSMLEKYLLPEDIDALLSLKKKPAKNMFEKYYSPVVFSADEMYLDLKGTLLLRAGKYAEALAVFEQLPEDFWQNTYHFADYLPTTSIRTNDKIPNKILQLETQPYPQPSKALIARDLATLKAKTESEDATAMDWYQYANALYNITYHGNAWMAYAYGKSSREMMGGERFQGNFRFASYYLQRTEANKPDNYYGMKAAISAYKKAIDLGGNSEIAAAASAMLAFCDQLSLPYYYYKERPNVYHPKHRLKSEFYKDFADHFRQSEVYRTLKATCPDIQ